MFIGNIVNIVQHSHLYNKQILLYGSDVQLYNEKAFQNNIKIYIHVSSTHLHNPI
jgi:hypothetical protein